MIIYINIFCPKFLKINVIFEFFIKKELHLSTLRNEKLKGDGCGMLDSSAPQRQSTRTASWNSVNTSQSNA
jgi:hypothetical protein